MLATGNRHPYDTIDLNLKATGNKSILLAVHDQRNEMLTTGKTPDFVGYMRSGFGIPFAIGTKSGNALADDIALVVSKGLTKKGFSVKIIPALSTETHEQVVAKMQADKSGKPVILHLSTWHSDCYQVVWYYYNLVLQIYDDNGKFVGQKIIEGKESLGGSFWNPPRKARKVLPPALKKRLEEIFNDDEMVTAIQA